jgi:Na+-driven multidrug efflux pump
MSFNHILSPGYIIMIVSNCLFGVMRGAGDTMGPMWISLFGNVGLRVPLAYVIAWLTVSAANPPATPNSIFWSLLIQIVIVAIVTILYYRSNR